MGRRIFHLLAATGTTLLALLVPEPAYLTLLGGGALLALALEEGRRRTQWLNRIFMALFGPILKPAEATEISGATWFLIAAFFAFYFYGAAIAVPALLFVAVGDPTAALIGRRAPGPRLWGKSPVGTLAFIVAGLAVWALLTALGFGGWSAAVIAGVIVAAVVELLPIPLDDNLTVPLVAGGVMMLWGLWG